MLSVATEASRLLLHDKYLRILALEVSVLFPILSTSLYFFLNNIFVALLPLLPALAVLYAWLRREADRRRRTMGIFRVVAVREIVAPFARGNEPLQSLSIGVRLTIVDAARKSIVVRYVDYERRERGERLLLILDGDGRVLAAAPLSRPPKLEVVLSLGGS
ncbi:MAG: hypothetical protein NZ938_00240 [Aigarchaeota archaeon]|nr:hypothetical protein [Candidatus Calditenuaceae archaeon]